MKIFEVGCHINYEGDYDVKFFKHESGALKYKKWLCDNPDDSNAGYADKIYCDEVEVCEEE